jgi:formylglycine-generating enzyme required for sulfatase activity
MKSTFLTVCVITAVVISILRMTHANSDELDQARTPAADRMVGQEAGQVRDDNGLTMKFVWCPPGFIKMEDARFVKVDANVSEEGAALNDDEVVSENDESAADKQTIRKITPVKVFISRGYWLGKFEVTQLEWKTVMATEPWKEQRRAKEGDDLAATYVNWDDAMTFCRKLTMQERKAGRLPDDWEYTLPTEAQWERACRSRTETQFNCGDDAAKLGEFAWCRENAWDAGEMYAHRVGQKKSNAWGLFDMHGNAYEWCRDYFTDTLPGGRDPEVTARGSYSIRVIRGGCWSSIPSSCRSAHRHANTADERNCYLGFRVALSFDRPPK